jgi:ketosteroid isomerase-like protein
MKRQLLPLLSVLAIMACNQNSAHDATVIPDVDSAAAKTAIMDLDRQYAQAFLKGDSAAISAFYTADAQVFPPNIPAGDGRFMGSMTTAIPKSGITVFRLNTDVVSGTGDQWIETGNYELGDSSKTMDKGHYLVVWKKVGNDWKMYRDIWNSSNPMAAK